MREKEVKVNIFVPAGPRIMAGDPQGRSELIARQDWGKTPEAKKALKAGIGFGLQIQAPERLPDDFDPKVLGGLPYGIHAHAEGLTQLYAAEQEGNQQYINEFWAHIDTWSKWTPKPLYVAFHGASLGTVPSIDQNRFNLTIEPEEWLELAKWHEKVFTRIREKGLGQAVLETVALNNYYGPPYFPENWLPITHLAPRVGIYHDAVEITRAAGVGAIVDFEHLEASVAAINGKALEIQELQNPAFTEGGTILEFERYFGFAAERGKICRAVKPASWEGLVSELNTNLYHVGGIQPQVIEFEPSEEANTKYHQALKGQLEDWGPYAWELVCRRRGGSHAPISRDDVRFQEMLRHVLVGRDWQGSSQPVVLVIETADYREGKKPEEDPGYWYWARPDAMQFSLNQLRQMLMEEL